MMQSIILEQGSSYGGLVFTRKAHTNFTERFKERIAYVFQFFPELRSEIIHVGWIAPNGWARGSFENRNTSKPLKINLQPNEKNFTIAHEFTHLLQATKKDQVGIPFGEKACDIWTLTRLPLELIDDYPSYIGNYKMRKHWNDIKVTVRELAFDAIEIRKTKRQYIAWLEHEIKKQ